ncbi:hypothetical protein [Shewanella sp. ALD9]|jgi:hypothetical protein|uniref:hypothetical protein n=1 Tax=unclassified Shewanella TaxID=196818 RepID=UPI000C31BA47|nr:hypothetical protein [Shewanella sp. ALD9]PKH33743.1 hypothetical protein CXF88_06565 [Shewanella sp. ALD9]|tara:strand:- start:3867 stop:4763 length:897 start_codon:yes stop_codon:yes gene_type:complete
MEVITVGWEPHHSRSSTHSSKEAYWLKPVLTAFIIHVLLIYVLIAFWYQDTTQRVSALVVKPSPTAIKSYLMTSAQYQSITQTSLSPKLHDLESARLIKNFPPIIDTNVDVSQSTSINAKETPISLDEDNNTLDNVMPSNNKPNNIQPHVITKKNNVLPSQIKPKMTTDINKSAPSLASIQQATSHFIQQNNIAALDTLVGSQTALQNKPTGTMSEMDPNLDFIELAAEIDISQPHTFNHRLDPNRIVKQGDYCYRVVELATQVNPHGWGLGFATFCGEDQVKKQLTEAIRKRVNAVK